MKEKMLIVLSGGQDSTTCAFWARHEYPDVELHAVTFDYGQRHAIEIDAARTVAKIVGVASHEVIELGAGILHGTSPLVNKGEELEQYRDHQSLPGGLEKTFVPMRNQLFLTIAANRAYCIGARALVTGVCQEDFGGYPDCRDVFISAIEDACKLGTFTDRPFEIFTPLMYLTKAASVELALRLPECYKALAFTHTSYDGMYPPTGHDHATLLRAKGFEEANVPDPLILRAWHDGLMKLPAAPNYAPELVRGYSARLGYLPEMK